MVWVHFPGLSLEYWDEETLFTISRAIGVPIKVDAATLQYQSGYYAKVLIEIDLAKTIPKKLWIITKFGAFSQGVTLTKLPKFCIKCKILGHLTTECRASQQSSKAGSSNQVEKVITIEQHQSSPSSSLMPPEQQNFSHPHNSCNYTNPSINLDMDKLVHDPHISIKNHSTEVTEINTELNVINSTVGINVTNNPFEVLHENENDLTEPEDGEIKEINTANLLEFGTIPQNITIIPKISTISHPSDEVGSSKSSKKKPPLKPAVVTRKASKESLKHVIDKGSLSPQPPPFK
ncbi:uncharacterized protein LOC113279254 [Papaver somniferum]|uniref:uncharacterized protein LOC113279254 n=1 Tax=Papaver somniferum TaxID=3469 RepID=UPI000E706025|nr:uncharacterized protein LOC113279254 [Papaver somniferum]